jgi:two-component system chemotaxis response regulator CheY
LEENPDPIVGAVHKPGKYPGTLGPAGKGPVPFPGKNYRKLVSPGFGSDLYGAAAGQGPGKRPVPQHRRGAFHKPGIFYRRPHGRIILYLAQGKIRRRQDSSAEKEYSQKNRLYAMMRQLHIVYYSIGKNDSGSILYNIGKMIPGKLKTDEAKMKTVLVVDDSRIMRNIVMNTFNQLKIPCQFIESPNGRDALEQLQNRKIDLVLLDWNMPELSGIDFLKKVRAMEQYKGLPIIMITSESAKYNVIEALKSGATDYIVKPVNDKVFFEKISKISF